MERPDATEFYNITDLTELVAEVESRGEQGLLWGARLRECIDRYDMAGLLELIEQMGGAE